MEEKDKWINSFRNRMEDYSEPAPADLWEQLEKELSASPKVIPMWYRWQAVAAIALLVIVSSLTVWFWNSPSAEYIENQSVELADIPQQTDMDEPVPARRQQPLAQQSAPMAEASAGKVRKADAISSVVAAEEPRVTETDEKQIEESHKEEQKANKAEQQVKQQPEARTAKRQKNNFTYAATPRKRKEANWAIGLSTGNVPFSASNGYSGYDQLAKGASVSGLKEYPTASNISTRNEDYGQQIFINNLSEDEITTDVKHRMPITFGASLRIDLGNEWAVETGVTYTQLSSELRSGGKNNYYEDEQRLHYVGIPLKVNRNIWSNRRFEVYASAGGMVEKCVSSELNRTFTIGNKSEKASESEDLKVKPLQWSLSAAAGAQFKITDKVGIYAEPGVVYYFDDGSDVTTIRKEHPFNFNIQLGVRLTLPK